MINSVPVQTAVCSKRADGAPVVVTGVQPRHVPPTHVLPAAQAFPHAPQCNVDVASTASQPFAELRSQSAKPALQSKAHPPARHAVTLPALDTHALPQLPQFISDDDVSVSQPLLALESQSASGSVQAVVHIPDTQAGVAPGRATHAVPHAPQSVSESSVFVSQPLAGSPSQSAKGATQVNPHDPALHVETALAGSGHTCPHTPQCSGVVSVLLSQPFSVRPSQSAKGVTQLYPQLPARHSATALRSQSSKGAAQSKVQARAAQRAAALAGAEQAIPQPPQFARFVRTSTSQPFAAFASQFAKSTVHAKVHSPEAQPTVAPDTASQGAQEPQCSGSARGSTSQPFTVFASQSRRPALQTRVQAPPTHVAVVPDVAVQAIPQPPQLARLVSRSVSQPFVRLASQSPRPASQVKLQLPPTPQVADAPGGAVQVAPHEPQVGGEARSTSQPFAGSPSQSPRPGAHAYTQAPATQDTSLPSRSAQGEHEPQRSGSEVVFVSQPLAGSPSQSESPPPQS
jgi:hypothetical protein